MVELMPCWFFMRCNKPKYGTSPRPIPCKSTTGGAEGATSLEPAGGRYQYETSPACAWIKPACVSHTQPTACAVYLVKHNQFGEPSFMGQAAVVLMMIWQYIGAYVTA